MKNLFRRSLVIVLSVLLGCVSLDATTLFMETGTDSTQDFTFFSSTTAGVNSTITSDSTVSNTGPRSFKVNTTAAGVGVYTSSPAATAADAGTRLSMWVRFSGIASISTPTIFVSPQTTGNLIVIGLGINTNGTLRICGRGATAIDGIHPLGDGSFYHIVFSYKITSTTNWSAKVWVNDILELVTTNVDGTLATTGTNYWRFGYVSSASVDSFSSMSILTTWYDDIYIDDGTGVDNTGNIKVTSKRPVSNGTLNEFTTQIGSGGSGYGSGHSPQTNEQPLSTTNGWSKSNTTLAYEVYVVEGAAVGDVDITNRTIVDYIGWIYAKVDSTANTPSHAIVMGATAAPRTMTTSYAFYFAPRGVASYPSGTDDIGMYAGYITTPHLTSLAENGIVIAYNPGTCQVRPLRGVGC